MFVYLDSVLGGPLEGDNATARTKVWPRETSEKRSSFNARGPQREETVYEIQNLYARFRDSLNLNFLRLSNFLVQCD